MKAIAADFIRANIKTEATFDLPQTKLLVERCYELIYSVKLIVISDQTAKQVKRKTGQQRTLLCLSRIA
ncbi:MAG: hypothetical protein WBB01_24205 [Phormidesmis sp.]